MRIGGMLRRNSDTWLTHIFGRGLDDERYVVESYRSLPSGEIRPVEAGQPKTKGHRRTRRKIVSREAVRELRPERDEIIVCTGVKLAGSGIQLYDLAASGLCAARNAR